MGEDGLRRELAIRTVLVTWRAADRTVAGDGERTRVRNRALALLAKIASDLDGNTPPDVASALRRAVSEIDDSR